MLYGRRKLIKQLAATEAEGQVFWTTTFDDRSRLRIWALIEELGEGAIAMISNKVNELMKRELGVRVGVLPNAFAFGSDDHLPSLIEATLLTARGLYGPTTFQRGVIDRMEVGINEVMNEHRISYKLVDGQMVEFQSMELHHSVVEPTLRLLSGQPGWENVEASYQEALRQISRNSPANAITDAGTALQEALTLLGCEGNALGGLLKSAKRKGLLAPHDSTLTDGIEKIISWVSADRSESGDSHKAAPGITTDDAWFTVHVVGALILRLAQGPRTAAT